MTKQKLAESHKRRVAALPKSALTPEIFSRIRKRLQVDLEFRRQFSQKPAESLREFGLRLSSHQAGLAEGQSLEQLARLMDIDNYKRMVRGSVSERRMPKQNGEALKSRDGSQSPGSFVDIPKAAENAPASGAPAARDLDYIETSATPTMVSATLKRKPSLVDSAAGSSLDRTLLGSTIQKIVDLQSELAGAQQIVEKVLIDRRWALHTVPLALGALDKVVARAHQVMHKARAADKTTQSAK